MLNSTLHSLEHYCACVADAYAIMLSLVQYGAQYGFSHIIISKYRLLIIYNSLGLRHDYKCHNIETE